MGPCVSNKGQKIKHTQPVDVKTIAINELNKKQIQYLTLIYYDLANRSPSKLLNQHNFSLFFQLYGLWGDKLFKYFSPNNQGQITLIDFLNGIRKIVRSSFDQKMNFLFNIIKNPNDNGIKYKQFLKMLYHYSKPQLKQIMTNDGVFVHQAIIPSSVELKNQSQIVHLKHDPQLQKHTSTHTNIFEEAIKKINMEYQDPGTLIQFKTQKVTYQVSYCNMSNLTKQYTSHIFKKYNIDQQKQSMNFEQFKDYVSKNTKLFLTYYAVFHEQLWSYVNNRPQFITHIQKNSNIIFIQGTLKRNAYMMLVSDSLIISENQNERDKVLRIIILQGVGINQQQQQRKIMIKQSEDDYKVSIQFGSNQLYKMWVQELRSYTNNYFQNKYQILEPIGTGKFSVVFKCRQRGTNKQYALKKLQLEKLKQKQIAAIENQTQINKILNSPYFAKLHETVFTKKTIYIVSQYIYGEDLFQFIRKKKRLAQSEAAFILGQIIQAVIHLHSIQIIHRDLKPENIMVSYRKPPIIASGQQSPLPNKISKPKPERIKIIDFGFANFLSALLQKKQDIPVGTLGYIAPQLLLGQKPSYQNDIFSIGCIMFLMLRGKYPFNSTQGVAIATVKGIINLNDSVWQEVSDQAKQLLKRLLATNPHERISLKQALNHPWFSSVNSYVKQNENGFNLQNLLKK